MSISKRILFGDDPSDDGARQLLADQTARFLEPFKFKIPSRRRNRLSARPYWDPFWASCIEAAARELEIQIVHINDQACTRTQLDADVVRKRSEEIHRRKIKDHSTRYVR
jgi:hypothetical protein